MFSAKRSTASDRGNTPTDFEWDKEAPDTGAIGSQIMWHQPGAEPLGSHKSSGAASQQCPVPPRDCLRWPIHPSLYSPKCVGLPLWAQGGEAGPSILQMGQQELFCFRKSWFKRHLVAWPSHLSFACHPRVQGAGQLNTEPRAFGAIGDSYLWQRMECGFSKELNLLGMQDMWDPLIGWETWALCRAPERPSKMKRIQTRSDLGKGRCPWARQTPNESPWLLGYGCVMMI